MILEPWQIPCRHAQAWLSCYGWHCLKPAVEQLVVLIRWSPLKFETHKYEKRNNNTETFSVESICFRTLDSADRNPIASAWHILSSIHLFRACKSAKVTSVFVCAFLPCAWCTAPQYFLSHATVPLATCSNWLHYSSCGGRGAACSRRYAVEALSTISWNHSGLKTATEIISKCAHCYRLERGHVFDDSESRFAYELRLPKLPVPIQGAIEMMIRKPWTRVGSGCFPVLVGTFAIAD